MLLLLLGATILFTLFKPYRHPLISPYIQKLRSRATVADRLEEYGPAARSRMAPHFKAAGVPYPPGRITFLGLKEERRLEVYAGAADGEMALIRAYPVIAASGQAGPKLREGDGQVPEGVYRIEGLNPNSLYHLSLKVSYPGEFDRKMAAADGRRNLGGDIFIHGSDASVGCLAMGDAAVEELFVLAADTGRERVNVIISPVDFRVAELKADSRALPEWIDKLYREVRRELDELK